MSRTALLCLGLTLAGACSPRPGQDAGEPDSGAEDAGLALEDGGLRCEGGDFDAGRLAGEWQNETHGSGGASTWSTTTFMSFRSCGLDVFSRSVSTFPGSTQGETIRYDFRVDPRRVWAGDSTGPRFLDHVYYANQTALVLNPFWPEGPHDGSLVGRWARQMDAGASIAAPWSEIVVESDGGASLITATGEVRGVLRDANGTARIDDGTCCTNFRYVYEEDGGIAVLYSYSIAWGTGDFWSR